MITRNYDITIESGADFLLTLWTSDDEGNPIDLTGATISAQLREYPEAAEYKQFTIEHNGEGGVILLTMPHEDTADIAYTSGVYDVFVTPSGGTVMKVMMGDATITPSVTRPVYGQIAYLLEFASEADFPPVGQTRRVYFSQATTKMYTWNGTAYVGYTNYYTKSETDALLSGKSDVGHNHDDRYYTETEMDTALALKANSADVYSKSDVDTALSAKEDIANLKALAYKDKADFYDDIDNLPSGYPPSPHNHDDRYYTEGEMDTALSAKADASDVYSKSDVDTALSGKSDTGHTHTMSDVTDLPTLGSLAEKNTVDWDTDIDDIPSTFPPSSHTHTTSDITDFPTLGTMSAEDASDYYTKSATDALLQDKADIILSSASGNIASFTDGSPHPVSALTVEIEPVQDLHGYDHPWSGGNGQNIFPPIVKGTYTGGGLTVVVGDDGLITVSGTKNTNDTVFIELPYEVSGQYFWQYYWIHIRNDYSNSSIRFYWGNTESGYIALNATNRIVQRTSESLLCETAGLRVSNAIASGTELNFTLQPSIETTDSVTDWTPYSNICPISGHTSATVTRTVKNLLPTYTASTVSDVTFTVNDDGSIALSGTASSNDIWKTQTITLQAGSYIVSGSIDSNYAIRIGKTDGTIITTVSTTEKTFTLDKPTTIRVTLRIQNKNGQSVSGTYYPMIRLAAEADSTYEPYQGTSLTVDLDGTRYGGTLNVLTGEMTVTDANIASYAGETLPSTWISDRDVYTEGGTLTTGAQVVYKLATPLTVQLTPAQLTTLLGENHIWASTGDTSVTYRADTKLFIERLTKPTEDDMVANTNIASGKYFMVGNNLYLSTASIANGAKIIVGTNCTALSLADALNNLS